MTKNYFYRNRIEAKIKYGFLEVPLKIGNLYSQSGRYVLKEEEIGGCNYLTVCPEERLIKLPDYFLPKPINLEAVIKNNSTHTLKLPQSSLRHLGLRGSKARIIHTLDCFIILKPEDLGRYLSSFSPDDVSVPAAELGS